MKAIVDGDIVVYRCAFSCEKKIDGEVILIDPVERAIQRMDFLINEMLAMTDSTEYILYLSGKNNFRYEIFSEYKANRKDKAKPVYLEQCRQHLIDEYGAIVENGHEADDSIGIAATACNSIDDYVICSIDKDLLQIPGKHFNFVKKELQFVSPLEASKNFYKQLVLGDVADNIPGYDGKARQKVPKFLEEIMQLIDNCGSEIEMYEAIKGLDGVEMETLDRNACLLHILRETEKMWEPPVLEELDPVHAAV